MMKYILLLTLILSVSINALTLFQESNLDFEISEVGKIPFGWEVPNNLAKNGYSIKTSSENPKQGLKCLELSRDLNDTTTGVYGSAMQSIDATRFRGKRIRFSAYAKAQLNGTTARVELWMKEKLRNDADGYLFKLEDRPVVHYDWDMYSFEYDVSKDAERINFGILLFERGMAWLDDCKLEIVSKPDMKIEPLKNLDLDDLDRLKAFAKAFGYLAFFHPSDEIIKSNVENLLYNGIKNVSNAKDNNELIKSLITTFNPIAPSAVISSNAEVCKYSKPNEAMDNSAVAWLHNGIYNRSKNGFFSSKIYNIYDSQKSREAAIYQLIDAKEVLGKTFTVSASIKTNALGYDGNAQIWLRIDREDTNSNEKDIYAIMEKSSKKNSWEKYSNSIKVPLGAKYIRVGLVFIGDGQANFDNLEYFIEDSSSKTKINTIDFENYDLGPISKGWKVPLSVYKAGYSIEVTNSDFYEGKKSIQIKSDINSYKTFPKLDEVYNIQIGKSAYLSFPMVLYTDAKSTLPKSDKANPYESVYNFESNDRFSRLGSVVYLWNLLKHFDKRKMSDNTLDSLLGTALLKASADSKEEDFLVTMRSMLSPLNDAQARLWKISSESFYSIPLQWRKFGNRVIITKVFDSSSGFRVGDIVSHINNLPLNEYLDKKYLLTSGANNEFRNAQMMAEIRSGKKGSKIKINLKHILGGPKEIEATRDSLFKTINDPRPERVAEIDSNIVYIDLTRNTDKEVKQVLTDMGKDSTFKGIIFDLRGTSLTSEFLLGYLIQKNIRTADIGVSYYTKPDKKLITRISQGGEIKKLNLKLPNDIVFLCDERTSGYSESILSLVKDYNLGKIFGVPTAGAAGESGSVILPGNFGMSLSITDSRNTNGDIISNNSVLPDVDVPYLAHFGKFDRDMILAKALEYLKSNFRK